MKVNRLSWLVLLFALFTVSAAWCDVVAELMANDRAMSTQEASRDVSLQLRESELFTALLASKTDIQRFVETAEATESDILSRFFERVNFEVVHERRSDLAYLLEEWHGEGKQPNFPRSKKKVAMIYGNEVNLLDGEWRQAPDGRRFWVSNEYPEIVLSAAEYKKYLNNAATVED
ncbi:MAG TPA: hypothetical protein PLK58_02365 [Candidatus Rifleibacterium sp.]|jgi:hypothetical protein|nr:hypothetical protein [Candidatus Rifleibacterium sp.]HPW57456.1 hypothetical protein [Candidatus Rifleibacterium sp.]